MKGLRIVYYHLISDVPKYHYPIKYTITKSVFDSHVRYYKKYHEIITIDEAYSRYSHGYKFDKQLVITTDDGFEENYSCVSNILGEFDLKASFFLIGDCIDNKSLMWRHALYVIHEFIEETELNRFIGEFSKSQNIGFPNKNESLMSWSLRAFSYKDKEILIRKLWNGIVPFSIEDYLSEYSPYLTSIQINSLIKQGYTIGSHSNTHPLFNNLSVEEAKKEIENSINTLSEKFNVNINSFSFPFGRCYRTTKMIEEYVKQIRVVLGIKEGLFSNSSNPLFWERTNMEYGLSKIRFMFYIMPFRNTYLS